MKDRFQSVLGGAAAIVVIILNIIVAGALYRWLFA